jgi:hypothetical protein
MPDAKPDLAALWRDFARRVEGLSALVVGEGTPADDAQRAAGLRYLTRFLAAGLRLCIEADDADHPVFARMIDNAMSWGLDNPDCNYSWARVRGDACYRIEGTRGSARQIEFQVNTGHFADGNMPMFSGGKGGWRTVSHLTGDQLAGDPDGRFSIALSREERPGNWLKLDDEATFVLVRQYFDDWEHEVPGVFTIVREDASYPPAPLSPERLRERFERLFEWLDAGAKCWDKVSRLLLSLTPNTILMFDVPKDLDRPGLHGQSYGMGPFTCARDEAVIVEFPVPRCRMWSVALTNFWWETLEFGSRQTSLNSHWARVDSDGVFRGVIAHRDPGVPNWIDAEGCERGTLAVRFLFADATPKTLLRVVPFDRLRNELPPDTPTTTPAERSAVLTRRSQALQRRYAY